MMRLIMLIPFLISSAAAVEAGLPTKGDPFYWKSADFDHANQEYGALLLPITLGPDTVFVQLDLGKKNHAVYKPALAGLDDHYESTLLGNVQLSGKMAGKDFKITCEPVDQVAESMIPEKNGKPVIGLLGFKFFEDRTLTLDFIRNRFYLKPMPGAQNYRKWELPANLVRHKLLVQLKGKNPFWVMYDTGSSPFNLITGRTFFQELTGSETNSDTFHIKARHTNKKSGLQMECQNIQKELELGAFNLEGRQVCTDLRDRISFRGSKIGLKGILGNATFIGNAIVQIDFHKPSFKILKP